MRVFLRGAADAFPADDSVALRLPAPPPGAIAVLGDSEAGPEVQAAAAALAAECGGEVVGVDAPRVGFLLAEGGRMPAGAARPSRAVTFGTRFGDRPIGAERPDRCADRRRLGPQRSSDRGPRFVRVGGRPGAARRSPARRRAPGLERCGAAGGAQRRCARRGDPHRVSAVGLEFRAAGRLSAVPAPRLPGLVAGRRPACPGARQRAQRRGVRSAVAPGRPGWGPAASRVRGRGPLAGGLAAAGGADRGRDAGSIRDLRVGGGEFLAGAGAPRYNTAPLFGGSEDR